MKVNIGNYTNRVYSHIFDHYMNNKYGVSGLDWPDEENYTRFEKFLNKLEDTLQWIYNHSINLYLNNKKRKIKVRIDGYDTYSADHTLALIIVPLLKELRISKNGSPMVDNEDVPKHLHMTKREQKIFDEGSWNKRLKATEKEKDFINKKYHDRWDWILGEMIHAFECEIEDDWEKQFTSGELDMKFEEVEVNGKKLHQMVRGPNDTYKIDREAMEKAYARRRNGRMLFAKYYNALWW